MSRSFLIVPMRVNALATGRALDAIGPTADLTALPWFDGRRDRFAQTPYLASAVNADSFADHDFRLAPGVHLHWVLPAGLTRGSTDPRLPGGVNLGELTMPAAPNRWLIRRTVPTMAHWLVESDYVHPHDAPEGRASIAFQPLKQTLPPGGTPFGPPFLRLGRRTRLKGNDMSELLRQAQAAPERYLPALDRPLTALGHHDPHFAALYPNCHSVFGCHDDEPQAGTRAAYEVFGWYADGAPDPLQALLNTELPMDSKRVKALVNHDLALRGQPPLPDGEPSPEARAFALHLRLRARLGWQLQPWQLEATIPPRTLCYGRVVIEHGGWLDGSPRTPFSTTEVAVGNSVAEAVAAFLAATRDGIDEKVERQITALELAPAIAHEHLDFGAKLAEVRHAAQFTPVKGHQRWALRPRAPDSALPGAAGAAATLAAATAAVKPAPAPAAPATLPDRLALDLDELNQHQASYDAAQDAIGSRCQALFADWHRLMQASYPSRASDAICIDIAALESYLQQVHLDGLGQARAQAGHILYARAAKGRWTRGHEGSAESLAGQVARCLADIGQHLAAFNQGRAAPQQLELAQAPGPRYWRPNDPVVLLSGADAAPTMRHGGVLVNGLLACLVAEADLLQLDAALLDVSNADMRRTLVTNHVSAPPWHPVLMEWQAELRPLTEGANEHASACGFDPKPYDPGFIAANFTLPAHQPELRRRDPAAAAQSGFEYLSGRNLLNPGAVDRLCGVLAEKLAHLPLAFDVLQGAVAQPLGGFHEALLMRQAEPQLDIADPLGFAPSQALAQRVNAALGDFHPHSPVAGAPFHPIRTGELLIERLRLVDSFGQTREWRPEALLMSSAMGGAGDRLRLPPRIAQPARVHLHWLAAEHDDVAVNDHPATTPICGWLLPNFLDSAIDVYDAGGEMLGLIDERGRWAPAPASYGAPQDPQDIGNRHLAQVVRWIESFEHPDAGRAVPWLLAQMERSLNAIEPLDGGGHQSRALLIGRPIAVVRARLELQLLGEPATDQSWEHLRHRLLGQPASDHGFTKVEFDVRIGEHQQANDGTVGFWVDDDTRRLQGQALRFPHEVRTDVGPHRDTGPPVVHCSFGAPPLTLTVLLDPRAVMHASCGVLPTTSIGLPPALWRPALDGLAATFRTAPLLMPADQTALPLPAEAHSSWAWVQRINGGWLEVPESPVVEYATLRAAFADPQQGQQLWHDALAAGVLAPDPRHPGRALLRLDAAAAGLKSNAAAAGVEQPKLDEATLQLLQRLALCIRPASLEAEFGAPAVIREGWLQLRSTFGGTP